MPRARGLACLRSAADVLPSAQDIAERLERAHGSIDDLDTLGPLVHLWASLPEDQLIAELRRRGLSEAVAYVRALSRQSDEFDPSRAERREVRLKPQQSPSVAVAVHAQPRARAAPVTPHETDAARVARTTRRS